MNTKRCRSSRVSCGLPAHLPCRQEHTEWGGDGRCFWPPHHWEPFQQGQFFFCTEPAPASAVSSWYNSFRPFRPWLVFLGLSKLHFISFSTLFLMFVFRLFLCLLTECSEAVYLRKITHFVSETMWIPSTLTFLKR